MRRPWVSAVAKADELFNYYESIGLLRPPARMESRYRVYGPEHLDRVRFIQRAKSLGFSLDEVREVLRLRERGQVPCEHVLALLDRKVLEIDQALKEFPWVLHPPVPPQEPS